MHHTTGGRDDQYFYSLFQESGTSSREGRETLGTTPDLTCLLSFVIVLFKEFLLHLSLPLFQYRGMSTFLFFYPYIHCPGVLTSPSLSLYCSTGTRSVRPCTRLFDDSCLVSFWFDNDLDLLGSCLWTGYDGVRSHSSSDTSGKRVDGLSVNIWTHSDLKGSDHNSSQFLVLLLN